MQRLVSATEAAVDELLVDAVRENPHLPLPEQARRRYEELTATETVTAEVGP